MRLTSFLLACLFAFAINLQAKPNEQKKKPTQKSKAVQQRQPQGASKKQPQRSPKKTHASQPRPKSPANHNARVRTPSAPKQYQPHTSVQKKDKFNSRPDRATAVQPRKRPPVQTNKLPAVQKNKVPPAHVNNVPAVPKRMPPTRPNKETVQRVKAQHADFRARPRSEVASVQFNENYRIRGAQNWHGTHYSVFRSYRPLWHDRVWWRAHYPTVVLIGGGWYYWSAGFWFPAWGYDTAAAYYPYDGPIYVGSTRPFDRVVADVQALLQEQGYYRGEVDGLLGPLTRDALAAFQEDHGLIATAAIDEPTLDVLGLT